MNPRNFNEKLTPSKVKLTKNVIYLRKRDNQPKKLECFFLIKQSLIIMFTFLHVSTIKKVRK